MVMLKTRYKVYPGMWWRKKKGQAKKCTSLARKLNTDGKYIALVVSFERAGYYDIPMDKANKTLIHSIYDASVRQLQETLL